MGFLQKDQRKKGALSSLCWSWDADGRSVLAVVRDLDPVFSTSLELLRWGENTKEEKRYKVQRKITKNVYIWMNKREEK